MGKKKIVSIYHKSSGESTSRKITALTLFCNDGRDAISFKNVIVQSMNCGEEQYNVENMYP